MSDYGFSSGLFFRLARKILPQVPKEDTFEYFLAQSENNTLNALDQIDFDSVAEGNIAEELDLSINALAAKVVAFGLDKKIKTYYDTLEMSVRPFEIVLGKINSLQKCDRKEIESLIANLEETKSLIHFLRKNKNKIGTSLHLTVTTRKILEYIARCQELLQLKQNISSKNEWKKLIEKYKEYSKHENSIRQYIGRHVDLLALEIVEHNANKGEKYIAESKSEYWSFFRKSILGGSIISIFALIKICVDGLQLSSSNNALYYSLNYAICFILVKQFGGIIATKQPAVTASTLAKGIDKNDDLNVDSIQNITGLIRRVSRSQFISIVGNFSMAILFAILIATVIKLSGYGKILNAVNSDYLIKNALPSFNLIFFAAIAGCFLALSGLISGFIDNKLLASNIPYRIRNSKRFFKSNQLANFIEKKSGALVGNITLGFMLGSSFLLSNILPFSIDIRHIAFSSANIGYSIVENDQSLNLLYTAALGALLIGLVNFLVSFTITILLALKSRNASLRILPTLLKSVFMDFVQNPLAYYFYK